MTPRNAGFAVLGLALGVVGCARKPLRDGAVNVAADGSVPVVDGAADGTASEGGSSVPGIVMIDGTTKGAAVHVHCNP